MARPKRLPRAAGAVALLVIIVAVAGCGAPALDRRNSGDPRAGLSAFKFAGCARCHAVAGVSVGMVGPALDGEGSRRGAPWLRAMLPPHLRAHRLGLPPRDLEDLVAYLVSLR